jgi:hypothetical protein
MIKCARCKRDIDPDREETYGVYIYPQGQVNRKKPALPKPQGLKVSEGDFVRLCKQHFCVDCARSISGYAKTVDITTRYDAKKAVNLSNNGWSLQDIAVELNCPKDLVTELINKELENREE